MTSSLIDNITFPVQIKHALTYFTELWEKADTNPAELGQHHTKKEKLEREKKLNLLINDLNKEKNSAKEKSVEETKELFSLFKRFFFTLLDLNKQDSFDLFSREVELVTENFVKQARAFDPSLKKKEIFQACRNVWIMTGLQEFFGIKIELTPSILAYSLLYPLSDNYLDNESISIEEKIAFNKRLSQCLGGEKIKPLNLNEEKIYNLIKKIESQFPRSGFPLVYESLLSIHSAQKRSLKLNQSNGRLSKHKIRNIVFEKGGTSVVADGYLVAGNLQPSETKSLFGYGVYLQLLDDIQDIKQDLKNSTRTIFSSSVFNNYLDNLTNRTFWFGQKVMAEMSTVNKKNDNSFIDVMNKSLNMLLIESVCLSDKHFTKSYINYIENFSPITFKKLKKLRSDSSPEKFSYLSTLDKTSH